MELSKRLLSCVPVVLAIGCAAARQPAGTAAERLALLHKALSSDGDPHDAILEIARIGNASSVPFLIEALSRQGAVPREGPYAAIDTRDHCLEALQMITNQDAGRNAEDWHAWYEENKAKPQEQWVLEGFAQRKLPVANPPDDAFITALIRASDPKPRPGYIHTNALRLLTTLPVEVVMKLARPLAASAEPSDRRATVAALERVGGEASLAVLRTLTIDGDVGVAENALRALNSALRVALPAVAAETLWDVRLAKAGVHILHALDDRTVVLGIGYGIVDGTRVVGFDLVAHRVAWTYATRDSVRSNAVRLGDRLYFVSDDRVVHCISIDGKPQWARPLTSNPNLDTTGPPITAVGDRLFVADGKSIYVLTLSGQMQAYPMGDGVSRHLVQGRNRVFGAIHNGPLLILEDAVPPRRVPTGLKTAALSASDEVLCIVSFGPAYNLQCLELETLRELWRAELPNESSGYGRLLQDADNVYVLAQGRALAFDKSSGKRLWATNEFTSGAFFEVFGGAALTRNGDFQLEWRDRSSGEVIARWGKRDGGLPGNAVLVGEAVLIETHHRDQAGLRLLRLPDAIKQRPPK